MEIREAVPGDARALAGLRYAFRAEMNPPVEDEETFVARCAEWMAERLVAESPWHCWVVEDGGKVLGALWLQLIEKIPNPGPEREQHGYITNVFVSPSARGAGAGERLLREALDFCQAELVDSVILWPSAKSRTLYARHGFAVRDDLMEAVLDEGRDIH